VTYDGMSDGEAAFLFTWRALGGPNIWTREYRFAPPRRYRFDFACPDVSGRGGIAVEIEGGSWTAGRHTRGAGFSRDCAKYNLAASMGWVVYRLSTSMAADPTEVELIMRAVVPAEVEALDA
jgi:hypothetical protein